jgi:hypothetical protein
MANRGRVAMVAAFAVLVGACARPTETASRPMQANATTTETIATARAVPLVLETGAPPGPPTAEFVVHSGEHDDAFAGHLFTADWTSAGSAALARVADPVPWPKLRTIAGGDDPTIAFNTPFTPDFVVVKVFTDVDSGRLTPIGIPIATFGCNRFTAPKCRVETSKSGIRLLDLDQTVYSGTYLVVFSQWHSPTKQSGVGQASDDVAASWLFRIAHTRATQP